MEWLNEMIPFLMEQESLHNKSGIDVEGEGNLTYGYGHLDSTGDLKDKISLMDDFEYQSWADSTLKADLFEAFRVGRQSFSNNFSGATLNKDGYTNDHSVYDSLPDDAKAIITDFQFNLGNIKAFPKLMNALKKGDWETVEKEYVRKLHGEPLGKRNDDTFKNYIEPNLPQNKVFDAILDSSSTPALDSMKIDLNEFSD